MLDTPSVFQFFSFDPTAEDSVKRLLGAACGLIGGLLIFTTVSAAPGETNTLQMSTTFSMAGPEISLMAVRSLGLAAH